MFSQGFPKDPGWTIRVCDFVIGVKGSLPAARWSGNLSALGISRVDQRKLLMRAILCSLEGTSDTLKTVATGTIGSQDIQEQKRLPPCLANDSTSGLPGRRLLWGFMLRACLCGVRARVAAGSCNEANMTLRVVPACACAACVPMCSLHVPPVLPCSC